MQQEWKFTFRDSLVLSIAQKIWRKKAAPTRGVGKSSLAPLPALPRVLWDFTCSNVHRNMDSLLAAWLGGAGREERGVLPTAGNSLQPGKGCAGACEHPRRAALRQPGHGAGTTWLMAGSQSKRHGT